MRSGYRFFHIAQFEKTRNMVSTGANIALAVFSFLALGCGVTYSVLVGKLINFIFERLSSGHSAAHDVGTAVAMIGLAFIIPGVLGLIACCVRRSGAYLTHCVLSLSSIGILAGLFFTGLSAHGLKSSGVHFCEMTEMGCQCDNTDMEALLKYFNCHEINTMVRMGISTSAMFWGGGVITLITGFLSGAIRSSFKTPNESSQPTGMKYLPHAASQQFSSNPYKRFDQ